ncbi:nicotinate-nucleotide--dimethylbenzimidazole phosphoribosyltransferase [Streptomyces sp. NPDC003327]
MTDTGQVPGEGLPENAGMVEQPGIPAPGAYTFLDPSENAAEDDDLLLMPGAQGAWSEHPPGAVPAPPVAVPAPPVAPGLPEQALPHQGVPHAPAAHAEAPEPQAAPAAPPQAVAPTGDPLTDPLPDPLTGPLPDPLTGPYQESAVLADQLTAPASATPPQGVPLAPQQVQGTPAHGVPLAPQEPAATAHGYEPGILDTGAHEAAGRDSGSVDLGGVRVPPPAAAPPRRPLHMGPPVPEGTGVVRSLADRGPAAAPVPQPAPVHAAAPAPEPVVATATAPMPVRNPGPPTTGPEYFDIAQDQQLAPQGAEPWAAQPQAPQEAPEFPAETVVPAAGQFVQVEGSVPTAPHLAPTPAPEAQAQDQAPAEAEAEVQVPAQAQAEAPVVEQPVEQAPERPVEPAEPVEAVEAAPVAPDAAVEEPADAPAEAAVEAVAAPEEPAEAPAPQAQATVPAPREGEPAAEPTEPVAPEAEAEAEPQVAEPVAAPVAAETDDVPAQEQAAPEQAAEQPEAVAAPEEPVETPAEAAPVAEDAAAEQQAEEVPAVAEDAAEQAVQPEPAQAVAEPAVRPEQPVQPEPVEVAHEAEPVAQQPESLEELPTGVPEEVPAEALVEAPADVSAEGPADVSPEAPAEVGPPAPGYDEAEREAVLRVMRERRDIRNGFRSDPIPHEVLLRVLEAAHTAPSVGHSQPWDFVVIRSAETRQTMHELAQRQREAYAESLPKARAKQFKELKIEAILDTPVNIVVTADPTRGGRHTLGRYTQPQMAPYSSALAVENLWLAARAEGLGVGWVSFFDEREMVRTLGLPEHLEVVAYLCVGYVDEFPAEPELMQAGWSKRRPLAWVVHEETYGRRALPGEEPHDLLQETVANIRPLDAKALGEAWERQKRMTKPAGALGMLEIISAQLSGLSRMCPPPIPEPAAVAIFAGDHGVHAQGVTPWPQEVTGQMVANFLGGGAVCNAFAHQVGAEVCVIDVGVASELPATPGLLPRKVRPGTGDFTTGLAMTREEVLAAIEVGIETARDLVAAGNKALLTGEMGIANTTASAALISVYTGVDAAEVTGRGTGINDETHARKVDVVRRALDLHKPDPADPIGVLSAIGGLEHAALVGLILGAASLRTPVILDGVSTGAAALVARAIAPESLAACIAGHRSAEPGHVAALNKLGLRPLVDLDLRLGEGTGALLALPLVQSAARAMHEVATFDSAGVTEK